MSTLTSLVGAGLWLLAAIFVVLVVTPRNNGTSKRRKYSNDEKKKAIQDVINGRKQKDVAAEYGISPGLMNDWIKNKEKYLKAAESGKSNNSRVRISYFPKTEASVLKWLKEMRAKHVAVNGLMLAERATEFAKLIPEEAHFKASQGWVKGFRNRNEVIRLTMRGEANSVNLEDIDSFKTGPLVDVLNRYNVNDIFNCDEAGLQYLLTE